MNIDYYYCNPTENITLLVKTETERSLQPYVAAVLMKKEPEAEQTGFLEYNGSLPHLQMAGGEFCGNASMSAAAVYALENGIESGRIRLSVSGAEEPVEVSVNRQNDLFEADIRMPRILGISEHKFTLGAETVCLPVVELPGIKHIISENVLSEEQAKNSIVSWAEELQSDCIGIMLIDGITLTPYVYSASAGTLFRESSCASGTTAAGAYLRHKTGGPVDIVFEEPGGCLRVRANQNESPVLSGKVTGIVRRKAEITIK